MLHSVTFGGNIMDSKILFVREIETMVDFNYIFLYDLFNMLKATDFTEKMETVICMTLDDKIPIEHLKTFIDNNRKDIPRISYNPSNKLWVVHDDIITECYREDENGDYNPLVFNSIVGETPDMTFNLEKFISYKLYGYVTEESIDEVEYNLYEWFLDKGNTDINIHFKDIGLTEDDIRTININITINDIPIEFNNGFLLLDKTIMSCRESYCVDDYGWKIEGFTEVTKRDIKKYISSLESQIKELNQLMEKIK